MKKIRFIQTFLIASLFSINLIAQETPHEIIHVKSVRFAAPLLEKWASEFEKINPQIEIKLIEESPDEEADLHLVNFIKDEDTENTDETILFAGRYALLPVTNAHNPLLSELGTRGVNGERLESLFFEKGALDKITNSSEDHKLDITVYSGNKSDSFAGTFASHFGYSTANIRGRKISGDDIFLIHAIRKDQSGITFNHLSYIFDIETRTLKEGLSLLPLDVKRNERDILLEADLDKTIALLEKDKISLIPVEKIGFVYRDNNDPAKKFLRWILSEGQRYNHEFGFLKTETTTSTVQLKGI